MFDSADEDHDGAQDKMQTKIKVDHSGTNRWLAPSIIKSSCKINVRYFPFDEQVRVRKGIPGPDAYIGTGCLIRLFVLFLLSFTDNPRSDYPKQQRLTNHSFPFRINCISFVYSFVS